MSDEEKLSLLLSKMKVLENKRENAKDLKEYNAIGCELFNVDLKIQACKNRLGHKKLSPDQFVCRKDLKSY